MIYGFRVMFNRNVENVHMKTGGLTYVNRPVQGALYVARISVRIVTR